MLEVAAVAVPSEWGEDEVKVVVVLKPGRTLAAAELIDFLEPNTPRFMIPRFVEFVESLPKDTDRESAQGGTASSRSYGGHLGSRSRPGQLILDCRPLSAGDEVFQKLPDWDCFRLDQGPRDSGGRPARTPRRGLANKASLLNGLPGLPVNASTMQARDVASGPWIAAAPPAMVMLSSATNSIRERTASIDRSLRASAPSSVWVNRPRHQAAARQ